MTNFPVSGVQLQEGFISNPSHLIWLLKSGRAYSLLRYGATAETAAERTIGSSITSLAVRSGGGRGRDE